MHTVDASTVFRRAWQLYDGGDFDDDAERPGTADFRRLIASFAARLKDAWECAAWPDLVRTQKRYFRELWNRLGPLLNAKGEYVLDANGDIVYVDRFYDAQEEVFYPNTGKYYQSLRDSNFNNRPADADGVENSAWWAESAHDYTADDWAASTVYAVGAKVRNEDDDEFYQCHTAHTSGASFDGTKFGLLTQFVRYVEYEQLGKEDIGTVLDVREKDPRVFRGYLNNHAVPFNLAPSRIEVTRRLTHVWVKFRQPCPELANVRVWDSTRLYLAGDIFYYTETTATNKDSGNFHKCLFNTASGENPDTFMEKFALVQIPRYFEDFLVHGVAADLQQTDTEYAVALGESAVSVSELQDDVWNHLALPEEERETRVVTR
jgi:hypothetical protein